MIRLLSTVVLSAALLPAGAIERSSAAKRAFQRENPCPSTGARRGSCPGFVVDHPKPLCAGGLDSPENMAWQTIAEAKRKDVDERLLCRRLRSGESPDG